ncbi:hypothetical protein TorRG33x02_308390, partial [Trema orientale]
MIENNCKPPLPIWPPITLSASLSLHRGCRWTPTFFWLPLDSFFWLPLDSHFLKRIF